MNKDSIIYNIIKQLTKVSIDKMIRKEDVKLLTPIVQTSEGPTQKHEPEGTFLVGKETPKGEKFIFEDMMTPIASKELYSLYMNLSKEEFIPRFNKTIFNYIQEQLKEARDRGVPYKDNLWFKANVQFVNWFQKNGVNVDETKSLLDNDISEKEDWNGAFWSLADELRSRKADGEFQSYEEAYQFGSEHYTKEGNEVTPLQLKRNYHKAKSEGRVE